MAAYLAPTNIFRRLLSCRQGKRLFSNSTVKQDDLVLVDHQEEITLIGINRPEKRNCVNTPTADLLLKAFQNFNDDPNSKVAVLYGVGGNFCAGFDLEQVASTTEIPESIAAFGSGPMGPSRYMSHKPVIAAVEGFAVAGGLELALWCDMRVVEDTALMGVYCRRFGVPLIDGGTVRLPAIIGFGRAMDMILTGRAISGKEAFEWGLSNRIVACGTAIGQAVNLAGCLLKFPQECMKADRQSAYYAAYSASSLQDALRFEHENGLSILEKESIGGAKRFVDGTGRHGKFNIDPISK